MNMKRVKIYWDPMSEDEDFFDLEEGVCGCGVEPQDLESTDFIYVRVNDLGVPACKKCHKFFPIALKYLEQKREIGVDWIFVKHGAGFPVIHAPGE